MSESETGQRSAAKQRDLGQGRSGKSSVSGTGWDQCDSSGRGHALDIGSLELVGEGNKYFIRPQKKGMQILGEDS